MDFKGDIKKLSPDERMKLAKERVHLVLKELDIDFVPILAKEPHALTAKILWIDIQNEELLKSLGLSKFPEQKTDESTVN